MKTIKAKYAVPTGLGVLAVSALVFFQNCGSNVHFADASENIQSVSNTTIDPLVCAVGSTSGTSVSVYPTSCLTAPSFPADVLGVEMNNYNQVISKGGSPSFDIAANNSVSGTSSARTIYVEMATYVAPDTMVLTAELAGGSSKQLINLCNVGTWNKGDPTSGVKRPLSDTILTFSVSIPAGTTALNFDFSGSTSPTYLAVWNLGDFSSALNDPATNPYTAVGMTPAHFRVVTGLPTPINDNADTAQTTVCPN